MKVFLCALALCAAAAAAPGGARAPRGIYGESALPHLHHDALHGTHAHIPAAPLLAAPAPLLHAAPSLSYAPLASSSLLHAPLASSSIRYAPLASSSLLHHAPLSSSHSLLSAPLAPAALSHSHIDTPLLHGNHFDTLHTDVLHAHAPAPLLAPAPILHHAPAPILHHAPAPILHHAPAPILHHAPAPILHHAPARTIKITKILHAPAQILNGW